MKRSIIDVINKIIDIIPIENSNFIYNLKKIVDFVPYCSPEIYPTLWERLSIVINQHIPFRCNVEELEHEWQKDIIKIFVGKCNTESINVVIE